MIIVWDTFSSLENFNLIGRQLSVLLPWIFWVAVMAGTRLTGLIVYVGYGRAASCGYIKTSSDEILHWIFPPTKIKTKPKSTACLNNLKSSFCVALLRRYLLHWHLQLAYVRHTFTTRPCWRCALNRRCSDMSKWHPVLRASCGPYLFSLLASIC